MSAVQDSRLPGGRPVWAPRGSPAAYGAAPAGDAQPAVWRDSATFSAAALPRQVAQGGAEVRAQGLPGWVSVLGFIGIWGLWGFPAALLGVVGFWATGKLIDSVSGSGR